MRSETLFTSFGQRMSREVKQVSILPGFVQSKSSGNVEMYPHYITVSPLMNDHTPSRVASALRHISAR
jgi:hypothetical protein